MEKRADLIKSFNKYYPGKKIKKTFRWDEDRIIIVAPEFPDEMEPFYEYHISDGKVYPFSPGEDFFKFSRLMVERG